jgi:hypothetical protein
MVDRTANLVNDPPCRPEMFPCPRIRFAPVLDDVGPTASRSQIPHSPSSRRAIMARPPATQRASRTLFLFGTTAATSWTKDGRRVMRNFPREPPDILVVRVLEAESAVSAVAAEPLRSRAWVGNTWNSLTHEAAGKVMSRLECRSAGNGDVLKANLAPMAEQRRYCLLIGTRCSEFVEMRRLPCIGS